LEKSPSSEIYTALPLTNSLYNGSNDTVGSATLKGTCIFDHSYIDVSTCF
jgi:hypothetical protein